MNEVSKSQPFGHNGIFQTLRDVIVHHFNPIQIFLDGKAENSLEYGKIIDSRDEILSAISIRNDEDINDLVAFMHAL